MVPELKNITDYVIDEEDKRDKYAIFLEWCQKEGVINPKMEYPAHFDGLIGARCKEDINYQEAFLFVPYKMMLSTGKA